MSKPKTPEIEFPVGPVKVKADINLLEWGRRQLEGTNGKSESFHNMSDDAKQTIKNINSTLREQIKVDNKTGAVSSLNQLASLYKQQSIGLPTQLRQEAISIANHYSQLAVAVDKGQFLLKQLQLDILGSTNQSKSEDIAAIRNSEYINIVNAYMDENGKVDSVQLGKDLKDNNASKETINGVFALVTPEMQQQVVSNSQLQMG